MKKLIFLLLMAVALIGFMPAQETGEGDGGTTQELLLGFTLSGNNGDILAVKPDTASIDDLFFSDRIIEIYKVLPVREGEKTMINCPPEKRLRLETLRNGAFTLRGA